MNLKPKLLVQELLASGLQERRLLEAGGLVYEERRGLVSEMYKMVAMN